MRVPALRNTADNPSDRAYWRDLLRHDRPAERYRSVMRRGLDWLDSRLSSHKAQQRPAQKAWSCGLLNATMALALAILFWPSQSNGSAAMRLILAVRR